jgi:hypothetical protein
MKGVEWTKIKHTHSGCTLRHPSNINLNINNERQDCKIGTVCGGRVKEGIKVYGRRTSYTYKKQN